MASLPPHLWQVAQRAWGRVSPARQVPPSLGLLETALRSGREHGGALGPSVTRLQEAEEHLPVSFNYGDTVSVLHGGEKYYGKEGKFLGLTLKHTPRTKVFPFPQMVFF